MKRKAKITSKCSECRIGDVKEQTAPYRYGAGGLPNVVLLGVTTGRCVNCGVETMTLPRISQLHRVLAAALATKATHLTPNEARFLRKYLGFSTTELAGIMGIAPETISRWESAKSAQPIGGTSERLLRLIAMRDRPIEEYPSERLAEITDSAGEQTLRFESNAAGWYVAA